jgi:hypothetical protein
LTTKKKVLFLGFILIILLIIIMVITTPTKKEFEQWILNENEIVCHKDGWNVKCMKGNQKIRFSSSHYKNVAVFASYEIDYQYENGEQITFRTFGLFGKIISMKDGMLWEKILN